MGLRHMAKQKNIQVIAKNLPAGEDELLDAAAQYFANRLLTPKQQKAITLLIDVGNRPIRVPLSRDMLSERPGIFGASLPSVFEMSVSTAAGIKDALEVIAHELVHVSQVLNRRLRMRPRRLKSNKLGQVSYSVSWLGDKFPSLDEFPWHLRPWEIEACQWQTILVAEFIERMSGVNSQIVTQRGRNNQLALLNVRPFAINAPPQSPTLSATKTIADISESLSAEIARSSSLDGNDNALGRDVSESENNPDFDKNSAGMIAEEFTGASEQISSVTHQDAADEIMPAAQTVNKMVNGGINGKHYDAQNGDMTRRQNSVAREASNDGENTAIKIRIDGLEAPRLLSRGALNSKLDDLLARGLIAPEDAKAAQTLLTSADD